MRERTSTNRVERVLLIDDKEPFLRHWKRELARRSVDSSLAENRAMAVEAAQKQRHQLAIVDLFLGSENGLDTVEALLAINPSMPVILVSAEMPVHFAVEAMRIGTRWACNKPIDWDTVIAIAEGSPPPPPLFDPETPDCDARMRAILEAALEAELGNQSKAAKRLSMHRTSFRRRAIKLGVNLRRRHR